jgi:hypothetical protein
MNPPPWPAPLAEEAFHGPAGEFVQTIEPHSESDPAALLFQFLVAVGNLAGRGPHFAAEGDLHSLNEYLVVMGKTAKGRKGSSWGRVRQVLAKADPVWAGGRILGGLSSGEGLIYAVRDPQEDDEGAVTDPGVPDKRLLAFEAEFAQVLKQVERQGNTLSPVLRAAWETGTLRTLTKNSPTVATGAHVSVVGHGTIEEVRRYLSTTEIANGFGNRHLWVCARRSKVLPEGGNLEERQLQELSDGLAAVLDEAQHIGKMERDGAARAIWREVYGELSEGKPGLAGCLLARGEAHVMRLACIYAVLDTSRAVREPHLLAALACWDYVEASVRHVFGDSLGDPVADELLRLLLGAKDTGVTRTEVRDFFGRNRGADKVSRALGLLLEHKLARFERWQEKGTGRPTERWFATGQRP